MLNSGGESTAEQHAEGEVERVKCDFLPAELPIADEHGTSAMDAYFKGAPPFTSVKSRNDIPDAFIFEAIKDALRDGPLHVVTNDRNLGSHLSDLANCTVHRSVLDFIQCGDVTAAAAHAMEEQHWKQALGMVVSELRQDEKKLVERLPDVLNDALMFNTVTHEQIPEDNSEATISGIESSKRRSTGRTSWTWGPGASAYRSHVGSAPP